MKTRNAMVMLLLTGCAGPGLSRPDVEHTESPVFTDAQVIARSALPPYTGVIETWVTLTVKVEGSTQDLLVPYFSAEQHLPEVGATCDFSVHRKAINGIAGKQVVDGTFTVVDHTQCHKHP